MRVFGLLLLVFCLFSGRPASVFVHMLTNFGWKAALGIIVADIVYFLRFRSELSQLKRVRSDEKEKRRPIPMPITIVHILFLIWTVVTSHHAALVVLGFLFFLAFVEATDRHQGVMRLRGPMLVGFFLASLVIHGGCQKWWIAPVLTGLTEWPMMIGAIILTAFNDNAAITYLALGLTETAQPSSRVGVSGGRMPRKSHDDLACEIFSATGWRGRFGGSSLILLR